MVATLYHIPRTISSPIVQILIELNLINNPIHIEEISFRALKSKEYLAINPMGTSPTFHDTELNIRIWESGAVLTYLLERYDTEYMLYPKPLNYGYSTDHEIQIRTKYLHIKQFIIATVYPFVATMFLHSIKPTQEQDKKYMTAAKHKCQTIFCPLLIEWIGVGPYLLGEDISAIDFLAIKPLRNMHSMEMIQHDFPLLYEYYERITNRPSYVEAYNDGFDASSMIADRSMILIPTKTKQQQVEQRQNQDNNSINNTKSKSSSSSSHMIIPATKVRTNTSTTTTSNEIFESYKNLFDGVANDTKNDVATVKKRNGNKNGLALWNV